MSEIDSTTYLNIATDYSNAVSQLQGISNHYYDAAYEVVLLSVFDPSVDLLQPFYTAYLASASAFLQPSAVITAVGSLQRHILDRATKVDGTRYTDINDWMVDESILVPQYFADLSASAGYAIDDTNIQP